MPSKSFFTITEVSELLAVPASALRYWEDAIPMFKPNRLPGGHRRFTESDVKMAARIKELLYIKGLKIDAAIKILNQTFRKSRPHPPQPCHTTKRAVKLLSEAMGLIENKHAISKIKAVADYLNALDNEKK